MTALTREDVEQVYQAAGNDRYEASTVSYKHTTAALEHVLVRHQLQGDAERVAFERALVGHLRWVVVASCALVVLYLYKIATGVMRGEVVGPLIDAFMIVIVGGAARLLRMLHKRWAKP